MANRLPSQEVAPVARMEPRGRHIVPVYRICREVVRGRALPLVNRARAALDDGGSDCPGLERPHVRTRRIALKIGCLENVTTEDVLPGALTPSPAFGRLRE